MTMEKALTTGDGRLKENWIYISFWRTEQCVLWEKKNAPCFSLCNMNQVLLSYGIQEKQYLKKYSLHNLS